MSVRLSKLIAYLIVINGVYDVTCAVALMLCSGELCDARMVPQAWPLRKNVAATPSLAIIWSGYVGIYGLIRCACIPPIHPTTKFLVVSSYANEACVYTALRLQDQATHGAETTTILSLLTGGLAYVISTICLKYG